MIYCYAYAVPLLCDARALESSSLSPADLSLSSYTFTRASSSSRSFFCKSYCSFCTLCCTASSSYCALCCRNYSSSCSFFRAAYSSYRSRRDRSTARASLFYALARRICCTYSSAIFFSSCSARARISSSCLSRPWRSACACSCAAAS